MGCHTLCPNIGAGAPRQRAEAGPPKRLGPELTKRVTNQDPPNRHWRFTLVIPEGGVGGDLQHAVGAVIPVDRYGIPKGRWMAKEFF